MNQSTMMTCLFLIPVAGASHVGCQSSNDMSPQDVAQQWQQNHTDTLSWLRQLPPAEREIYAMFLVESDPQNAHRLCELFSSDQDRYRCTKLGQRPHLWTTISSRPTSSRSGPSGTHLVPEGRENALFAVEGEFTPCQGEPSDLSCILNNLSHSIYDPKVLASKCNALEQHWRHECYFEAAELRIQQPGNPIKGYQESVSYCEHALGFESNCFRHLNEQIAAANIPSPQLLSSWEKPVKWAEIITEHWSKRDPKFGQAMREHLWTQVSERAVAMHGYSCFEITNHLPKRAQLPYLDALIARTDISDPHFAHSQIRKMVDSAAPTCPKESQRLEQDSADSAASNWASDTEDSSQYPARFYRNDGRCVKLSTLSENIWISILEATARKKPESSVFDTTKMPNLPAINWTIRRHDLNQIP